MLAILILLLGLIVSAANATLTLPYYGTTSTDGKAFWVSNTYAGAGMSYGGFFYAAGQESRGVFGQSDGSEGMGVKGWAKNSGDVENYGGHFTSAGERGIGVCGWAENTGDAQNYGGFFLAEGDKGIGLFAIGGPNGVAAEFVGDVNITGAGNGIVFPDGTKQTTAGGGGGADSDWIISGNNMYSGVSGNVGIGTTSPEGAYKLTVDGRGSSYGIKVRNVGDIGIESMAANYGLKASGKSRAVWGESSAGRAIYGESSGGFAGYFAGKSYFNGNVGIGTTSPSAKLEVAGDVRINGTGNGVRFPDGTKQTTAASGGFPRPAYDSGWRAIDQGEWIRLRHNIGGDPDNYVIDMQFKGSYGTHTKFYGGMENPNRQWYGAYYQQLSTSMISVGRMQDDAWVEQVRIRIWVYN